MLEHPSDRCSCSAQVVRAHLAPPGRTVIGSRHRCEVRTRPSILGPMRPIVEFWGSRAWQWPNALAPFLNGDAPSRVAVAYTSGHCINVSQYLTRSTSPRGVPTEFCMLAVRLAVANAAPCDKDASGEVARSQCVLNCRSSPLRQKSRLAAQRLDIEMASRRMLAQRRADQRQERCTSTSPTR